MLGEIAGYCQLIYELEENDGSISSETVFHLIYECYDQMFKAAGKREVIIKYAQLKYAKRVCGHWISYFSGSIAKIKHALKMRCLSEVDYFREAYDQVTLMLADSVKQLKVVA